jgi:hypothetical protein
MSELEGRGAPEAGGRHRMSGQMTHLDPDVLAGFRAGLIAGRRGTRVAAHLAGCDRCAALSDQLAEVSALLAAVSAPAMPDSVAQRLDAVLAAEAARRDDSERAGHGSSRDRVTATRPARNRGWRLVTLRVLAPAAAIVVLAAGGYGISQVVGGSTSSTTAGSPAAEPAVRPATTPVPAPTSRGPLRHAVKRTSFPVISSSTDYRHATLRQQLEQELRAPAPTGPSRPASAQLKACVSRVTSGVRPGIPVLVESARYQDQPAIVIVASSGDGHLAWVMTPDCSAELASATLQGTSTP